MHEALKWAQKQGLNCEQEILAEMLRLQCRAQTTRLLTLGVLLSLLVVLSTK